MRILVTGAAGFVGRALVPELLARGHTLTLTDREFDPFHDLEGVRLVAGDIVDRGVRSSALENVEAVIHLATVAGGAAEDDPQLAGRVNVEATMALSREFGIRRPSAPFVFSSSIAVFGHPLSSSVDDDRRSCRECSMARTRR